jgi:hypothetical protein
MGWMPESANFNFLRAYAPIFLQLASAAERAFSSDPNTTLIKLRQLGEALAQDLAVRSGIRFDETTTQADLLWKLNREIRLDPTIRDLFHTLRIEGNKATHQFQTQHKEAMDGPEPLPSGITSVLVNREHSSSQVPSNHPKTPVISSEHYRPKLISLRCNWSIQASNSKLTSN